mgnify:CR=1 FL=1
MSITRSSVRPIGISLPAIIASALVAITAPTAQAQTGAPTRVDGQQTAVETRNKAIVQAAFEKWRSEEHTSEFQSH